VRNRSKITPVIQAKCEEEDLNLHAFRHQILSQTPRIAADCNTPQPLGFTLARNAPHRDDLNPDSARIAPTLQADAERLDGAFATALEIAARARKVAKLLEAIPAGDTAAANIRCAHELAGWPQSARDVLAAHVGVRRPSPLSWCILVATVAARRP
jgi:hypothetical protein